MQQPPIGSSYKGLYLDLPALNFALQPSTNYEELDSLRSESLLQDLDRLVHSNRSSAVEQVHGRITMLWPGVDRIVRFLNDYGSRDTVRFEFMERLRDHSGIALARSFFHRRTHSRLLL